MKKLLITLACMPFICMAQIQFNFQDSLQLEKWIFSTENYWSIAEDPLSTDNYVLHHNFDNSSSSTDYIATPIEKLQLQNHHVLWEFKVLHQYNPSSSNNWQIYLAADKNGLTANEEPSDGFVFGVNFTGYDDTLRLWKLHDGSKSVVATTSIDWQDDIGTDIWGTFRIIKDSLNNWDIYTLSDLSAPISIGHGIDSTFSYLDYLLISYSYSSSQDRKLWIDDIFIEGDHFTDTVAPTIKSFNSISPFEYMINFTEPIDTSQINVGVSSESYSFEMHSNSATQMLLTLIEPSPNPIDVKVEFSEITDMEGNIGKDSIEIFHYLPESKDIIINEVMYDPLPPEDLPEYEYIELYNRSDYKINLENWSITAGSTSKYFPKVFVEPEQYIIICHHEAVEEFDTNIAKTGIFTSQTTLKNSGSTIVLKDVYENLIDSIYYSDSNISDEEKSRGGWSLEKINPEGICTKNGIWKVSEDLKGGTPGYINSVYDIQPDVKAPLIVDHKLQNSSSLTFNCDEGFVWDSLSLYTSFSDSLTINNQENNTIKIISNQRYSEGLNEVVINNLIDKCGNKTSQQISFEYHPVDAYDVVISEIMADPAPAVGLPEMEYVELYNRSAKTIMLNDLQIVKNSSSINLPAYLIEPQSYLVLCDTNLINNDDLTNVVHFKKMPALNNYGDFIELVNIDMEHIHFVEYEDDWHTADKKSGGWSLEMIDLDNYCEQSNNWSSSKNQSGGTPGYMNSVFNRNPDIKSPNITHIFPIASNVLNIRLSEPLSLHQSINESLYLNPLVQIDSFKYVNPIRNEFYLFLNDQLEEQKIYYFLNDGQISDCADNQITNELEIPFMLPSNIDSLDIVINEVLFNVSNENQEFIEIANRSKKGLNLADLRLCTFKDGKLDNKYLISEDNRLLLPDSLCLLSKSPHEILEYYNITMSPDTLKMERFPLLNNEKGTIAIMDQDDNIIDKLDYSDDMHHAVLSNHKNVSLERVEIESPTNVASNWHSAAQYVNFATPGYNNSHSDSPNNFPEKKDPFTVHPDVFSPDNDGYNDISEIHFTQIQPGSVCNVRVFNSRGIPVRFLVQNYLLGSGSQLTWDGRDDAGRLCHMGIYIYHVQIYNEQGEVREYKVSTVLAGGI